VEKKNPRNYISALAKGIAILRTIANAPRPLLLGEIAKSLGTTTTTAIRLCYTLSELHLIRRDEHKRYHLTPEVLFLGYFQICGMKWLDVARYYLEQLFNDIQELVNLSVLEGPEIRYLIRFKKYTYISYDMRIGNTLPLYCTSMGRVLMAFGDPKRTKPLLKTMEFKPLTPHTIKNIDEYLMELKTVRAVGYGISDEDFTLGHRSIAAPILDKNGYAFAAINIGVPSTRFTREELESKMGPMILDVASRISNALQKLDMTEAELYGTAQVTLHLSNRQLMRNS